MNMPTKGMPLMEDGRMRGRGDQGELAGRTAIVTGAASGIGLAIARCCSRAGATVLVQDLDAGLAEAAAAEMQASGALSQGGDISDGEVVESMVRRLLDHAGRVDILVNNAGFQHVAPIEEFPLAAWQRMLDVMLTAPFLATQAVLPHMKRQRWGRILNVSSINGKIGPCSRWATAR